MNSGIVNVTAAPTTVATQTIQPGGSVAFLGSADIASLDPIRLINNGGTDGPAASMVFDMLFYNDLQAASVVPQTAESLTSSDALVWTMKLRPNIKFSDGTPYDAAAVRFNWLRLQDPKNAASRASIASTMSSIDVVDPVTLRITLKKANAVFSQSAILISFIGSPAAIQSEGDQFGQSPVGAGPFLLKSWVHDTQQTFVRNPGYWNSPRPYVDQVTMKFISDTSQKINTFASSSSPQVMTILTAGDVATAQQRTGVAPLAVSLNGGPGLYFNTRKAPFNDQRARLAVTMAVDRGDLIKTLDNGQLPTMDSLFAHSSPYYDGTLTQPGYDPTKAQQLFDQLASETGKPLQFTISTVNTAIYPLAAQYMQGVLNHFKNVQVQVDTVTVATEQARMNNADFEAGMWGLPFYDPDPSWTDPFLCASASQYTGWCSAAFDAAVAKSRSALDSATRITAIKDAQRAFYADDPAFFYELRTYWIFGSQSVQDVRVANDQLLLFDRLWIKAR